MESTAIRPKLQAKIEQKQKERQAQFSKLKATYNLNEKAKSIVQLPSSELWRKLQSREVSAREVLEAFTAKALEITEKFNCITEFIPQALEWASALDKEPNTTLRPLRGLPVAIKEDHDVEGMDTTLGFAKLLYKPASQSAVLVKILLKLGAVPFLKTNVPQSLFSAGSDNPIFGTTLNSLNPKLSPGGSSSGSGCIVGAGAAAFATGSDLGGSLRIPSHSNGICTIRPTINRLSPKGVLQCLPEMTLQPGVPGIMSPDAETLSIVWRAITENNIQNSFDPMAVPIPWNEKLFVSEEKLKIGYFTSLPFFPSFEDTRKTVLAAKDDFESKGHSVVEFEFPDSFQCMKHMSDLLLADGGRHLERMFSGEPVSNCVKGIVEIIRKSKIAKEPPASSGMTKREAILLGNWGSDIKTAEDFWDLANQQRLITEDILDRMDKAGIDLILMPMFPYPAVKLNETTSLAAIVYTMIWNFVDFPAGILKFGTETGAGWDSYDDQNDSILKAAREDISESIGMPISVQIVGTPFKEELVLRAMVELEKSKKRTCFK